LKLVIIWVGDTWSLLRGLEGMDLKHEILWVLEYKCCQSIDWNLVFDPLSANVYAFAGCFKFNLLIGNTLSRFILTFLRPTSAVSLAPWHFSSIIYFIFR